MNNFVKFKPCGRTRARENPCGRPPYPAESEQLCFVIVVGRRTLYSLGRRRKDSRILPTLFQLRLYITSLDVRGLK